MKKILLSSLAILFIVTQVSAQIINTIAGTGSSGYSGDGGLATSATFSYPYGAIADAAGNVYIADPVNYRVRKINTSGIITTYAGNGSSSSSGDGGLATSAGINWPSELALDAAGNLYIGEYFGNRVRKVTPGGIITTFAGNGSTTFSGDGGPATSAGMYGPWGIDFDTYGNLYIACRNDNRIRKVDVAGNISTVAGTGATGYTGDGGPALSATFSGPIGIAVDGANNVYICENGNHTVRKINTVGVISTVAGTGMSGYTADGIAATASMLNSPVGMDCDASGVLYIADQSNHRIRKVDLSGIITTVAGNGAGTFGGDGGLATLASLNTPQLVHVDAAGNLYIGDTNNNRVRKVGASSSISIACTPNDTVCRGTAITFSAAVTGVATPHYQWKKNGLNVGIDSSYYTTSSFSSADVITCEVSSSVGGSVLATSNSIALYFYSVPTSSRNVTICAPNSVRIGGRDIFTSGTYNDTLIGRSFRGCDSIATTILTVNTRSTAIRNVRICAPATFYAGGANRSTSGMYYDTLRAASFRGCDSILTTNLTVNSSSIGTLNVSICAPGTYTVGGIARSTTGIYPDTMRGTNVYGCDSILNVNLTVNSRSLFTRTVNLCYGTSFFAGGAMQHVSGIYYDTLSNVLGCDSILTSKLEFGDSIFVDQSIHICPGENYVIGRHTYNVTGNYRDTLHSAFGCDSVVLTHLNVSAPHAPRIFGPLTVTAGSHQSYTVNGITGLTYSWSLDNGIIHSGGLTDSAYTQMNTVGICHVTVTVSDSAGCDSSSTITVNVRQGGVGIEEIALSNILAYPNPVSDYLHLHLKEAMDGLVRIEIVDGLGQVMTQTEQQLSEKDMDLTIDMTGFAAGMYVCKIYNHDSEKQIKISKVAP